MCDTLWTSFGAVSAVQIDWQRIAGKVSYLSCTNSTVFLGLNKCASGHAAVSGS
jgi:hypothetical protein